MPATEITSSAQFATIKNSESQKRLCVVDFYATWCGPCKVIAPTFEGFATKYSKEANFYRVDVDRVQDVARSEGVTAMPTFKFYAQGKQVHEIKGANATAIEQAIQQYAQQHTAKQAFTGAGYSLSGASASPSKAQPSSSGSAQPGRKNPWANPDFANKMLNKSSSSSAAASSTTAAAAPANRNQRPLGVADPNYKPPTPSMQSPAASTATTDSTSAAPAPVSAGTGPEITVDPLLLSQLTAMGFRSIRAEKGLIKTNNKSVEDAMNWCLEHENDPDIDTPLPTPQPADVNATAAASSSTSSTDGQPDAAASNASTPAPAATPASAAGKKKIDLSALSEDDRIIFDQIRGRIKDEKDTIAATPAATMTAEQREAIAEKKFSEMSKEEQERWLANKRMEAKLKREKEERQRSIESEKNRQKLHSAAQEMKEQKEANDIKLMVERKRREEAEKVRVRNELRAKMAADKQRRQAEYERGLAEAKALKERQQK